VHKAQRKVDQCREANRELKTENEKSVIEIQGLRVEVAKLEERLEEEARTGSKALVAGNPNAKAAHLNNVKMEVTKLRHEKVKLEQAISEREQR
jgi:hypothetical protein